MLELSSNQDMDTSHSSERPSNLAIAYQKNGVRNGVKLMANLVGQTLGKYEITALIARGGMADVYKADKIGFDRKIVIKVMHGYLAHSDEFIARFQREAESIAKLRHTHIIRLHDFEIDDGIYYMIMEFMAGGTLFDLINEQKQFSPRHAIEILLPLIDALSYAHKIGIIHRDIKPANILFTDTRRTHPILSDFGITMIEGGSALTESGTFVGTPGYMSPEAGLGELVDQRSDIYSIGILLYEMLTGKLPFTAQTPFSIFMEQLNDPIPDPRQYAPDLPDLLIDILVKALDPSPEARYQCGEDLKNALEQVLEQLSIADINLSHEAKKSKLQTAEQVGLLTPIFTQHLRTEKRASHWTKLASILTIIVLIAGSISLLAYILVQNVMPIDLNSQASLVQIPLTEILEPTALEESNNQNTTAMAAIIPSQTASEIAPLQVASASVQENLIDYSPQTSTPNNLQLSPTATSIPPEPTRLLIGDHLSHRLTSQETRHDYIFEASQTSPAVIIVSSEAENAGLTFDLKNLDTNEAIIKLGSSITGACIRIDRSNNKYQLTVSSQTNISEVHYSLMLITTKPERIECQSQ